MTTLARSRLSAPISYDSACKYKTVPDITRLAVQCISDLAYLEREVRSGDERENKTIQRPDARSSCRGQLLNRVRT